MCQLKGLEDISKYRMISKANKSLFNTSNIVDQKTSLYNIVQFSSNKKGNKKTIFEKSLLDEIKRKTMTPIYVSPSLKGNSALSPIYRKLNRNRLNGQDSNLLCATSAIFLNQCRNITSKTTESCDQNKLTEQKNSEEMQVPRNVSLEKIRNMVANCQHLTRVTQYIKGIVNRMEYPILNKVKNFIK